MSETLTTFDLEAEISINAGPRQPGRITVEQEILVEWSATGTKPDKEWTHVDEQGHFHAYDDDGELPTLTSRTRHVHCDLSHEDDDLYDSHDCEGYNVAESFCRICGVQVEPGRVPSHGPFRIPGLKSWRAEIRSDQAVPLGLVSIQAFARDRLLFGAGLATIGSVEYGPDGTSVRTDIAGASPLGSRSHRAEAAS